MPNCIPLNCILALVLASCVVSCGAHEEASFCSIMPEEYETAAKVHPDLVDKFIALSDKGIAIHVHSQQDVLRYKRRINACAPNSVVTVVVSALNVRSCADLMTLDTRDYFLLLVSLGGLLLNRTVVYILEPGASEFLLANECNNGTKYVEALHAAVKELSRNENAKLYLEVADSALKQSRSLHAVADLVDDLRSSGQLSGIALNYKGYENTHEMMAACEAFRLAYGSDDMHCVMDTSLMKTTKSICSNDHFGIGMPPGVGINPCFDYSLWLSPPGTVNSLCDVKSMTLDEYQGGSFNRSLFLELWNHVIDIDGVTPDPIDGTPSSVGGSLNDSPHNSTDPYEIDPILHPTKGIVITIPLRPLPSQSSDSSAFSGTASGDGSVELDDIDSPSQSMDHDASSQSSVPVGSDEIGSTSSSSRRPMKPPHHDVEPVNQPIEVENAVEDGARTQTRNSVKTGFVVLMVMVGTMAVALAALIVVRTRQQRIEELKTPGDITVAGIATL